MKIRTDETVSVWILHLHIKQSAHIGERGRHGQAAEPSYNAWVCKSHRGKGWGLCKQVFMSRSEGLPITVCLSFSPFLICQSAGTDFLIFNIWSRLHACFLLLTEPTNLILMADRIGACLMVIFNTQPSLLLTHGPRSAPLASHHTSLLLCECFLRLFNPESDEPVMIWEAAEWTIPNFPPSSLSSFSCRPQTLRSRILFLAAIPVFCLSIKQTLSRFLSGLCQNKQLEHWTCIVNIWGNQTSGKNESWSPVIDVSAEGRGADGIWYAASPPTGCHCELCECRNIWK